MTMTRLQVDASGTTRAPASVVWSLIVDVEQYPKWGPWDQAGYERQGDDGSRHGVGAIRWLRMGRTKTVEQILELDDERRVVYTVVRGMPVQNYLAEVVLTPLAEGTRIDWSATWDRTLLGRVVRWKLRSIYPDIVARVTASANAQVGMDGRADS